MADDSTKKLFKTLEFPEQKLLDTLKNGQLTKSLKQVLEEAGIKENSKVDKTHATLLFSLASKYPPKAPIEARKPLVELILENKIKTDLQLSAGLNYLKDIAIADPSKYTKSILEKESGVGVVVTPKQIQATVSEEINKRKNDLVSQRYKYPIGSLLQAVRDKLKFADGKLVKDEVDNQILKLLGPKTEQDNAKPAKETKSKPQEGKSKAKEEAKETKEAKHYEGAVLQFHKVGENWKTENYIVTPKTMDLLKKHVQEVGGHVRTRFPPEPNGILHIGHAKAMNFNFGYAKTMGGLCYLRYDDTNPEVEEERYFTGIYDMCKWLGHEPWKVTYSSDYFQELYDLAVELIKRGKAYVDHQTAEQLHEERGSGKSLPIRESPYRNRPIEENLRLFEDMKKGKFAEGEAYLRMKQDMKSGNPQMWDLVAYRVKYSPHYRTGNQWCIYPTYDFTHCLVDSMENITHSLCTKEFKQARESYYWLCNALDVYCPVQWEYSRLNIPNTVLSKRKIQKLVDKKLVRDWDDPRLHTLGGLKRRGFPPAGINLFCEKLGITTADSLVQPEALEAAVRDVLNDTAIRVMAVLEPLKVTLVDYPEDKVEELKVPNHPSNASLGEHTMKFSRTFYIERSDFRTEEEKGYRRLTPKQAVGLKHVGLVVHVTEVKKDAAGNVIELLAKHEVLSGENKPKAFIHWVAVPKNKRPVTAECRLYDRLLLDPKGDEDWMSLYNPNSEQVIPEIIVEEYLKQAKIGDSFQFERLGYYCLDYDSTPAKMVFNRTVTLKEDNQKL